MANQEHSIKNTEQYIEAYGKLSYLLYMAEIEPTDVEAIGDVLDQLGVHGIHQHPYHEALLEELVKADREIQKSVSGERNEN